MSSKWLSGMHARVGILWEQVGTIGVEGVGLLVDYIVCMFGMGRGHPQPCVWAEAILSRTVLSSAILQEHFGFALLQAEARQWQSRSGGLRSRATQSRSRECKHGWVV